MNIKPTMTDSVPTPLPLIKQGAEMKHALHQSLKEEFDPAQFRIISEAWKSTPEVRPNVLEMAKQMATDPSYPTPAQLQQIAQMIVGDQTPLPPTVPPPNTEPPVIEPPVTEPPISANN